MLQYDKHKYHRPPLHKVFFTTVCVCYCYSIYQKSPVSSNLLFKFAYKLGGLITASSNNMTVFLPPLYSISRTIRVELRHQKFPKASAQRSHSVKMRKTDICNHRKLRVQSEFSRLITMSPPALTQPLQLLSLKQSH